MPELPEVETVARQLQPKLRGKVLRSITLLDRRLRKPNGLSVGARVVKVYRLGKEVAIEFLLPSGNKKTVLVHLRMTGRLLWQPHKGGEGAVQVALYRKLPDISAKSIRLVFSFNGGVLVFADTRRFGTVECVAKAALRPGVIDPVSSSFTIESLRSVLLGSKQALKPWLLRQDKLIGLGNIYASEILFDARLSPTRRAGGLSERELQRLYGSISRILKRAIKNCGTTFSDFQQTTGEVGGYQQFLQVYDRAGLPCRRCKTPIKRLKQSRSTFFCPHCQRRVSGLGMVNAERGSRSGVITRNNTVR